MEKSASHASRNIDKLTRKREKGAKTKMSAKVSESTQTKAADTDTVRSEEELGTMRSEAESIIKSHALISMAAGLIPIPVADVGVMIANQVKMVHGLSKIYGVPFNENVVKATVTSLVGGSVPAGTVIGLSFFKLIPGIGTLVGSGSVAVLGGAVTYAVGRVFTNHFESGGTLLLIDPAAFRERFKFEFRQAKADAQTDQKEMPQPQTARA